MKFAHIADCHLGGWREPKLQQLNLETFKEAVRRCIAQKVNFVLFAGDIFDTALPSPEILENAVEQFRILNESGIKCFLIAGSHDFSASGKTFLNVIEKAGLGRNIGTICSEGNGIRLFTEKFRDEEVVFAGVCGRKASLEQQYLKKVNLDKDFRRNLASKKGLKILALHTMLTEAKPKNLDIVESISIDELPKGFDYYALGHLHLPFQAKRNGNYVYPGPLFPNNFQELEELCYGSFVIVSTCTSENLIDVQKEILNLKEILVINIDANNLSPFELTEKIVKEFKKYGKKIEDKIVMLKISGVLKEGKTSEINFDLIGKEAEKLGCFVLLKNLHSLSTAQFKELEVEDSNKTVDEIEQEIIKNYFSNLDLNKKSEIDFKIISELMNVLNFEKQEGQTRQVFENKILAEGAKILDIDKILDEKKI